MSERKSVLERAPFTSAEYRAMARAEFSEVGVDRDYLMLADALDELRAAKARIEELERDHLGALGTLRAIAEAVGETGDELAVLAAVRAQAGRLEDLERAQDRNVRHRKELRN